jgi:hypothetical protein
MASPQAGDVELFDRSAHHKGIEIMKTAAFAVAIFLGAFSAAQAQSDMSCAELLKANAQLDAAAKAEVAKDPTGAALDKKINDYCAKNPTAKASEAMEKAMAD